jgi:ATP-dependent DNA ligase
LQKYIYVFIEAAINCRESIIVDGEIVVLDEKGYQSSKALNKNECRLD